eukprot:COSAG02_NODE_1310_length_13323_cov_17.158878_4_plen_211_part_00
MQSQLRDEFADYSPDRAFTPFEQAILGYTQHSFVSSQVIRESQYLLCPDFGVVYRLLRYTDSNERETALNKARQQLSTNDRKLSDTDTTKRLKLTHPRNAHLFHIDGGILYYNSPLQGEVVCVPRGFSTAANSQLTRNSCTEAGKEKPRRLTLRQYLIRELHNTPMSGHRGVGQTYLLLSKRYYWPGMKDEVTEWIAEVSPSMPARAPTR